MDEKWTWADYVDGGPALDERLIKIAKLLKRMRAWEKENGWMPLDSDIGRLFEKDMHYVNSVKLGLSGMGNKLKVILDNKTKIILNKIWKRYG